MQAPLSRDQQLRPGQQPQHEESNNHRRRTETANKFAAALGGERPSQSLLTQLLAPSVANETIVLTVPSLELEPNNAKSNVLPTIGEHHLQSSADRSEQSETSSKNARPNMVASVLSKDLETSTFADADIAKSISRRTSWTKSTLAYAPLAVSSNLAQSFRLLTDSRLKAWTLVLLKHSLSTGSTNSRSRLLSMLSTKIEVRTDVAANFQTLELPAAAQGLRPKQADLVLPLLFEVPVDVGSKESKETIFLRCPGTISCTFGTDPNESFHLKLVSISLDTNTMMKNMVDQARLVVLRAVSSVTNTNPERSLKQSRDDSALRGKPTDIRELKAKSSALRLSSVLEGKKFDAPQTTNRKFKMDTPSSRPSLGALAPISKKPRLVQTAAKLTSYKSFGRPHAGDSGGSGPRNATFGEFGGGSGGSWGRDGRLAEHPQPLRLGAIPEQSEKKNETFGSSSRLQLGSAAGAALLGRIPSIGGGLQRTPTALEHSLMKKYGG